MTENEENLKDVLDPIENNDQEQENELASLEILEKELGKNIGLQSHKQKMNYLIDQIKEYTNNYLNDDIIIKDPFNQCQIFLNKKKSKNIKKLDINQQIINMRQDYKDIFKNDNYLNTNKLYKGQLNNLYNNNYNIKSDYRKSHKTIPIKKTMQSFFDINDSKNNFIKQQIKNNYTLQNFDKVFGNEPIAPQDFSKTTKIKKSISDLRFSFNTLDDAQTTHNKLIYISKIKNIKDNNTIINDANIFYKKMNNNKNYLSHENINNKEKNSLIKNKKFGFKLFDNNIDPESYSFAFSKGQVNSVYNKYIKLYNN